MHPITQTSTQLQTVFGGSFVQENHSDATRGYLAQSEPREFVVDFEAVLKALRAALSLR